MGCEEHPLTAAPKPVKVTAKKPVIESRDLKARIDSVVASARARRLSAKQHAAWQVVHGILAFGPDLKLEDDGKTYSALDYLLAGGKLTGWNLSPGDKGVKTLLEAGSKTGQGHPDQWVGYLSQCGVKLDAPLMVEGHEYHVVDLLNQAQWEVHEGMEGTWTLMALSTYYPTDYAWETKAGEKWTMEKLVENEASQNIGGAACGGAHRLYALTNARNKRRAEKGKLEGAWAQADEVIQEHIQLAHEYQQPDGSFSINFFLRSGTSAEIAKRMYSTGHIFEFLMAALSDADLKQPWVTSAATSLTSMLEQTRDLPLECGTLYHAARGLELYRKRVYGPVAGGKASENPTRAPVSTPLSTNETTPATVPASPQ
jgi:hypothetical protein